MSVRRLIISFLLLNSHFVWAYSENIGETSEDSVTISDERYEKLLNYERRISKRRERWNALMPDYARIQYAGSTGLVNLGLGWEYGKNERWETDFMFGYVPTYMKDDPFATFTLRETFVPWHVMPQHGQISRQGWHWSVQPFSCGMFLNFVLDNEYWAHEPKKYPNRPYYQFSSKVRFHIFVGQRYYIHIPVEYRWLAKEIGIVWEISTNDLYVINRWPNSSLPVKEILSLSLGLKFGI